MSNLQLVCTDRHVNGAMIFVDIHITNNSSTCVKKIEIQVEKSALWCAHATAEPLKGYKPSSLVTKSESEAQKVEEWTPSHLKSVPARSTPCHYQRRSIF